MGTYMQIKVILGRYECMTIIDIFLYKAIAIHMPCNCLLKSRCLLRKLVFCDVVRIPEKILAYTRVRVPSKEKRNMTLNE